MLDSQSRTRLLALDERTCRIVGKGKATPSRWISSKREADPPKNVPPNSHGGPVAFSTVSRMRSSAGNCFCITGTIDSINEFEKARSISQTRSGRRRATTMSLDRELDFELLYHTTNGKVGQD